MFDFSTFPEFTTERLRLRALTPADTAEVRAMFADPRTLTYLDMEPTETPDSARALIDFLNAHSASGAALTWAYERQADGRFIGTGGYYHWDREHRRVDIGYHIVPEAWGRGYATEAARAMVSWCFDHLNVHRVQADCTDGNVASERVLLKCGFTLEGIWRESTWEHGRFVNIRQFGLLEHEYRAQVAR